MKIRLTSFILVLALSFSLSLPVFAVDDNNYYSLSPVVGSDSSIVSLHPVTPFATGSGWTDSDRTLLQAIKNALTDISRGSINWYLSWIYDALRGGDIPGDLGKIQQNTLAISNRILDSNSLLGSINTAVSGFATETSLSKLVNTFSSARYDIGPRLADFGEMINCAFGAYSDWFTATGSHHVGLNGAISAISFGLTTDSENLWDGDKTLYHYVKNLSQTLASEDDKQLAENYKENRVEAENDFLNGQSGPTSLGKGDFSNASQVGGALNDTFNMGGAAKVSDFLSGFGSAGTESQAWFSQTTANNLNAVEASDGTSGVSTFADDGQTMVDVDSDPYNMASIFERYDWLEGVNMDD